MFISWRPTDGENSRQHSYLVLKHHKTYDNEIYINEKNIQWAFSGYITIHENNNYKCSILTWNCIRITVCVFISWRPTDGENSRQHSYLVLKHHKTYDNEIYINEKNIQWAFSGYITIYKNNNYNCSVLLSFLASYGGAVDFFFSFFLKYDLWLSSVIVDLPICFGFM